MFNDLKKQNTSGVNLGKKENKAEPEIPVPAAPVSAEPQKTKGAEVEDIFAGSEKMQADRNVLTPSKTKRLDKPKVFQPKEAVTPPSEDIKEKSADTSGVVKKIIIGVVVLALALVVGYFVYSKFYSQEKDIVSPESEKVETQVEENGQTNKIKPVEETSIITPEQIQTETVITPKDSDKDGLSDEKEEELGTNINSIDTDNDGLYDREEVEVYETNPVNPDTDGDGFTDGDEVSQGYDPNGPGKLYTIDN